MLPRPAMRSQIMHIPTGLYLHYCFFPHDGHIHLVLSKEPALYNRNNLDLFEQVSNPSWDRYVIHNGDDLFDGTCDEFVLVEQRV
jgi:hypothetical protein